MLKTDVAQAILKKYGKKNVPQLRPGDTVRVHQKIREGEKERIQIFEGLVIGLKHGRGLDGTFTVRKIAVGGIGVERTYPIHSPVVIKVERLKTADVSQAKLYYMRDRRGKAARFKHEEAASMAWSEDMVTTEVEPSDPEEAAPLTEEEVTAPATQEESTEAVAEVGPTTKETVEEKAEVAAEATGEAEGNEEKAA